MLMDSLWADSGDSLGSLTALKRGFAELKGEGVAREEIEVLREEQTLPGPELDFSVFS